MATLTKLLAESGIPQYQCIKRVRALKIIKRENKTIWVEGRDEPIIVDATMLVRFLPSSGDYLVIYDDNYASFSPRDAFENGYVRL